MDLNANRSNSFYERSVVAATPRRLRVHGPQREAPGDAGPRSQVQPVGLEFVWADQPQSLKARLGTVAPRKASTPPIDDKMP